MTPDVEVLCRRLDTLIRAATRLRQHCPDLHSLAWEAHVGEVLEGDTPGFVSAPPRAGDPWARRLYARTLHEVAEAEAGLVGCDRMMMALFHTRSERPDPSRGSTISVADFDAARAKQRGRPDTPVRLEPQPQHPGKRT